MLKKSFTIVALLLCASLAVSAQKQTEAAKDSVFKLQEKLFSDFKKLENDDKIKLSVIKDVKKGDQFFINQSDKGKIKNIKNNDLQVVFNFINEKKNRGSVKIKTFYSVHLANASTEQEGVKGKKGQVVDADKYSRYTCRHQVNVSSDINSERSIAKYEVALEWLVEFNKKNGDPKNFSLNSVTAKEIPFTKGDVKKMEDIAKSLIGEWYKNLSKESRLLPDDARFKDLLTKSIKIESTDGSINCGDPSPDKKITATVDRKITLYKDASGYYSDSAVYSNFNQPAGDIFKRMEFVVSIDENLKDGKIEKINSVVYDSEFLPKIDKDLERQKQQVKEQVKNFTGKLNDFAAANLKDKDLQQQLVGLFEKDASIVQVSSVSSKEAQKRKAKEYFQRIKQAEVTFNDSEPVFEDGLNKATVDVIQYFRSKNYCDKTTKRLHLQYDRNTGTYKIVNIEVLPNSTEKCRE